MLDRLKSFSNSNLAALKALFGVEYDFEREAIVDTLIAENCDGRVQFRDSWWTARCLYPIMLQPGDRVYIVGIQSTTLIVEPIKALSIR